MVSSAQAAPAQPAWTLTMTHNQDPAAGDRPFESGSEPSTSGKSTSTTSAKERSPAPVTFTDVLPPGVTVRGDRLRELRSARVPDGRRSQRRRSPDLHRGLQNSADHRRWIRNRSHRECTWASFSSRWKSPRLAGTSPTRRRSPGGGALRPKRRPRTRSRSPTSPPFHVKNIRSGERRPQRRRIHGRGRSSARNAEQVHVFPSIQTKN